MNAALAAVIAIAALTPADVGRLSTPAMAVSAAATDLANLPPDLGPFVRYVWLPIADDHGAAYISLAINHAVSRASTPVFPVEVHPNQLLRLDLRVLAPRVADAEHLAKLWDRMANRDPYFYARRQALVDVAPYIGEGGKRFSKRWETVAGFGPHVDDASAAALATGTQTTTPIVRAEHFLRTTLTTLDGGLYYEFVGIERSPAGTTAFAAFLKRFGVTETEIERLRSDQRAAMFRSNVTGKPRLIAFLPGLGSPPAVNRGLIMLTRDPDDKDVDAAAHPIRNLLKVRFAAMEVIVEAPNGSHIFALFDSAGNLQNSAPDSVVKDHGIPAPFTARLQPGLSCLRCHGDSDGVKPVRNDVKNLQALNIFGDNKNVNRETLDRLVSLYSGDLENGPANDVRDAYAAFVHKVTGGLKIPEAMKGMTGLIDDYQYKPVTPELALRELGYRPGKNRDETQAMLRQLLPDLPRDEVGISPEDPILGALKDGIEVNRTDWEQVYLDAALRSTVAVRALQQAQPAKAAGPEAK